MTADQTPGRVEAPSAAPPYEAWVGREATSEDYLEPNRANGLRAVLEAPTQPLAEGDALPPLWHWCYFWDHAPQSGLGADGHAARGGFLPPVALPRRMWAGSELVWQAPLRLGTRVTRSSRIEDISRKEGRSGSLVFVTIMHRFHAAGVTCMTERQTVVYRDAPKPGDVLSVAKPAPAEPAWSCEVGPSPPLLFRYSALTFNSHRIHYDHPYVHDVEGYATVVVHGPLLATLMFDLLAREQPDAKWQRFKFRALAPVVASEHFRVCGRPEGGGARLWIEAAGGMAVEGHATPA